MKRNRFEWQACVSPSISWSLSRWEHKSTKKETKFVLRKFKIPLSDYVHLFLYRRCLKRYYRRHVTFTWKRLISLWRWYAVSFSFSFSFVRVLRRTRGQEHAVESESESFVATKARGSLLRWQGRAMAGSRSSGMEKQSRNEDSCSCPLARGTSQLQAFWRSPRYIPGDWDFEIPDTTLLHDGVTIRTKRSEVFIEKKGVKKILQQNSYITTIIDRYMYLLYL